jgi:hypothetical protein
MAQQAEWAGELVWAAGIAVLLVGAVLAYAGRKRRVGSDPHCRRCDYLLVAINVDRCPECGSRLTPDAIAHGELTRRFGPFLAGWTLLALSIIGGGAVLTVRVRNLDWYGHMPTWYVMEDLNSPATVHKAWTEMTRRDTAGLLGVSQQYDLVDSALARQANFSPPYGPFDLSVQNYLNGRYLAKTLSPVQVNKFLDQTVRTRLAVRQKVIAGDDAPYAVPYNWLFPAGGRMQVVVTVVNATLDGRPFEARLPAASQRFSDHDELSGGQVPASLCASAGPHHLALNIQMSLTNGAGARSSAPAALYSSTRALSASFDVVPQQPDPVTPVFDPNLAPALKSRLTPAPFVSVRANSLYVPINPAGTPVDFAFDVIARYGGADHRLASVAWCTQTATEYLDNVAGGTMYPIILPPASNPPAAIDVILKPDEQAARQTLDIYTFWNQEIDYLNVPVQTR